MAVPAIVFVYDFDKGNRYQIITDTHRHHATGKYSADSIVPQDHLPLSEVRYSENRYSILARIGELCPIYWYQKAEDAKNETAVYGQWEVSILQPTCD